MSDECAVCLGEPPAPPYCEWSGGKVVHFTEEPARQHVAELRADGCPEAYFYRCPCLITCPPVAGGCGREFPGTEHMHVASSPTPRRFRM